MLNALGASLTRSFKKFMPDAFVFALALTLITATSALIFTETDLIGLIQSWYQGFWMLLEFGMQMVLILVTGYSIALSPLAGNLIGRLTKRINSPRQVYLVIMVTGMLLSFVSWGWLVITAVFARELALRVKGLNYPYLVACVYFSGGIWVTGLSSTIPLLLNTQKNYLIEAGILTETISTSITLGSVLNMSIIVLESVTNV
jgi:short-chain fatty acids transporter